MDDDIPPTVDDPFYTEDPKEQINKVFRQKAAQKNVPISELAFGDKQEE